MRAYLAAYGATLVVLLVFDMAWLSTVGASVYRPRLGALLLDRPVLWAAALFYLVYAVGVVVFAVAPAMRSESWTRALWAGALFGVFAYATYDLTNLATVRGWSGLVTVLDIGWGAVLTALAASAGTITARAAAAP
ncbi:MAG TPA: DUF2177 family protein [Stellaceae bacterium]|nr:DUF2177 family protein [Stellaceae bacterium]